MKSKKVKVSPAKLLGDMQRAKMGVAKGSYLEGGSIVYGDDKKKKKRKVESGSWDFGIDGKSVEIEGKMITRRSGKQRFRADDKEDRKMLRQIKSNERKANRKFLKEQHESPVRRRDTKMKKK